MPNYKTVLVDLDGTLVDSAPGIVSTIAFTLEQMGVPVPTMRDLLRWIGPPLPESFHTFAGLDKKATAEALVIYRARYLDVGVYDAKLFDGVACAADDESRGAKEDVIEDALGGLRDLGRDTSSIVMIGDRIHDVEGARAHGIDTILVAWGNGSQAEWDQAHQVIHTPRQLHQALGLPGGNR